MTLPCADHVYCTCAVFVSSQESRYTKMEKADILEMTVRHLKSVQRRHMTTSSASSAPPPSAAQHMRTKYRAGYSECAQEVCKFLHGSDVVTPDVQVRLMGHLAERVGAGAGAGPFAQHARLALPIASLPVLPASMSPLACVSPTTTTAVPRGMRPAPLPIDSVIPLYVDTVPRSPRAATSPCSFADSPREGAAEPLSASQTSGLTSPTNGVTSPVSAASPGDDTKAYDCVWRPW